MRSVFIRYEQTRIGEILPSKAGGVSVLAKKKYLEGMNNFKNGIIALLTGLLALSLFTQPAQSAPSTVTTAQFNALQARVKVLESNALKSVKTYDAVKLIEFSYCLDDLSKGAKGGTGTTENFDESNVTACNAWKPYAPDSVKTYDAVKLTQYGACLANRVWWHNGEAIRFGGEYLAYCYRWRP